MLPASSYYTAEAVKKIRRVAETCLVSWLKTYDANLNFFAIGQSSIGGSDIIKGYENTVLEWDKYNYVDESKYVISLEYEREFLTPIGGMTKSLGVVNLDNYSDRFTPNYDPIIGSYILPKRPVKLFVKFGEDSCPVYIGQNEESPEQDLKKKITKLKLVDFLDYLWNYPVDKTVIYQNYRTDQLIEALLNLAGLGIGQYQLDTGILIIPFSVFPKGEKIGNLIQQITEAEMGNFYQDENGLIIFENRHHGLDAVHQKTRYTFDHTNILNIKVPSDQNVINVVEVSGEVREVQINQSIFSSNEAVLIPASSTKEVWADYQDPVTSVDGLTNFVANTLSDGSGTDVTGSVNISSQLNYAQASLITFSNALTYPVYLTSFSLTGTPAKITTRIEAKTQDTNSVSIYDERVKTIKNPFIQNQTDANTISQIVVDQYKDPQEIQEITIRGMPYLQLGDKITINYRGTSTTGYIMRIQGELTKENGFIQNIKVIQKPNWYKYFQIGTSPIGGIDRIAP